MNERFVEIPFHTLEKETLKTLIHEFINRDGTFYGEIELPMDLKVDRVLEQLKNGTAVFTWDLDLESSNIVLQENIEGKRK